ncbi:MAG: DUF2275 domain-containing protein [Geobacteraceae bacterium]|nr:DUF2275 domain-containing protein [Geobacteraceae bacterium]
MMMDHATVRSLLSAYRDGEVSPAERDGIEQHLQSCADCREELSELEKTVLRIRGFGEEEPPPWMAQKVMARVRAAAEERRGFFHWLLYPLRIKLPIEAAALVVIAATGYMLYRTAAPQLAQVVPQAPELRGSEAPPQPPAVSPGKRVARSAEQAREGVLPGARQKTVQRSQRKGEPAELPLPAPAAEPSPPPAARVEKALPPPAPEEHAEPSVMMERRAAPRAPMYDKGAADDFFGISSPRKSENEAGSRRSRAKSLRAADASAVRLVVEAADRDSAMAEIGAAVGKLGGSVARRTVTGSDRGALAVRLDGSRLEELHERLGRIGTVRGKVPPESEDEGQVEVTIEVVSGTE